MTDFFLQSQAQGYGPVPGVPPNGAGVVMGPPHMGPQNPQVYDFPMADDEGGKGKKKRERKKPAAKESKAAKSPKTPKASKGKNVTPQPFSG